VAKPSRSGCAGRIARECPGTQARFESKQNRQSSTEFKKNGHGQEERNGHHPFRGHGTSRARPVADFAEATEDEDQAQQNSSQQVRQDSIPGFMFVLS
jgi:hypothetical protein